MFTPGTKKIISVSLNAFRKLFKSFKNIYQNHKHGIFSNKKL